MNVTEERTDDQEAPGQVGVDSAPAAPADTDLAGPARPAYGKLAVLTALALVLLLLIQGPAASLLRRSGVLARPDRFTELSFTNRAALPVVTHPAEQIAFQFTIHNEEGHAVSYNWVATVAAEGTTTTLGRGTLRLQGGASSTIGAEGVVPILGPSVLVKVALPAQNQWIDFFAARPEDG